MAIPIIVALAIIAQTQNPVLHFFYSPDCGHCMDILLEDIPRLQKQYVFTLKKYDIERIENYKILETMEARVTKPGEDMPIVFIGDSVFYGPQQTRARLEGTLKLLSKRYPTPMDTSTRQDTTPMSALHGVVHVYYFYQMGCKECSRIEILLSSLQKTHDWIQVHRYDVFVDSSKILLEGLSERDGIPERIRLSVPTIIIGDDYLVKGAITLQALEALFKKYEHGSTEFSLHDFSTAEQTLAARFSKFSIISVLIAGLLDGVNPCAFATLIFFVSYLVFVGRRRRDIILMAIFFIIGVFITYLAIGIGAYNLLKYLVGFNLLAKVIFIGFGVIAFILGILSLRDYVVARRGELHRMILQLPLGIKQRIHKDIKEQTAVGGIILGSLVAGFFVSFLEFGCTGQVYLPTITFIVSKAGIALKPLLTLLFYNIMFVLPLVLIAVLAAVFTTAKVSKNLEAKIPTIKLFTAGLFFVLGILLLISA